VILKKVVESLLTALFFTRAVTVVIVTYKHYSIYTVFQKKTSTHIIGYKLRNSCPILIIFDIKIPHII